MQRTIEASKEPDPGPWASNSLAIAQLDEVVT